MLKYKEFSGVSRLEKAAENNPWIGWGANGPPIATLQRALVKLGHPMPKSTKAGGVMDGIFGNEMYGVTQDFQRKHGLFAPGKSPDGLIGKNTMSVLDAEMVKSEKPPPVPVPPPKPPVPRPPKPKPPPAPPAQIVKSEDRNNYDLYMVKTASCHVVVLTMSISFIFHSGLFGGTPWGSEAEKRKFMQDWCRAVETTWSLPNLYTSPKHGQVIFVVKISPYFGWTPGTEWTLKIKKIEDGAFRTSWVRDGRVFNTSRGDSEDLDPVNKGATMPQRAAVHEFGHMLGLDDEYPDANPGGTHVGDKDSIMHSGEAVRRRHHEEFRKWTKAYFGE